MTRNVKVKVAKTTEIPPGRSKQVDVEGTKIALFNIGGTFYAIDDTCTHKGGPLSEGKLENNIVTCPWHHAMFDVTNGKVTLGPAQASVTSYKVIVEGDDIEIEF